VLYDTDDGRLFYDWDGTGLDEPTHVLTLANRPVLTASSFVLEAASGEWYLG
jgi:hypothetical protein